MKQKKPIEQKEDLLSLVTGKEFPDVKILAARINDLIEKDFQQLISILYRMDVSEPKLRSVLKENPDSDAGLLIANLMIERQAQKIRSRQQFRQRDNNIDENEKW